MSTSFYNPMQLQIPQDHINPNLLQYNPRFWQQVLFISARGFFFLTDRLPMPVIVFLPYWITINSSRTWWMFIFRQDQNYIKYSKCDRDKALRNCTRIQIHLLWMPTYHKDSSIGIPELLQIISNTSILSFWKHDLQGCHTGHKWMNINDLFQVTTSVTDLYTYQNKSYKSYQYQRYQTESLYSPIILNNALVITITCEIRIWSYNSNKDNSNSARMRQSHTRWQTA